MNKGFTLIELLAVIVILALISGVGIMSFSSITKKSEEDYYANLVNNLELKANDYYSDHRSQRPGINSGDYVCSRVSLEELVNNKYLDNVNNSKGESCDLDNSFVYIKRNADKQYEYKVLLVCDDYYLSLSEDEYCRGEEVVETSISLSAYYADNVSYNVTQSYYNTQWVSQDVTVNFLSSESVSRYVITNMNTNDVYTCNAVNNQCSASFSSKGTYNVVSYNGDIEVARRSFNIKIDKVAPSFNLDNNNINIAYGSEMVNYEKNLTDIVDESGISRINYILLKGNEEIVNTVANGTNIKIANLTSDRYTIKVKAYDKALNESAYLEKKFNVTRSIKLVDVLNDDYNETHEVVNRTNYNYLGVDLPTLTTEGYTFLGWYTTSTGTGRITNTSVVDDAITTLYARWE